MTEELKACKLSEGEELLIKTLAADDRRWSTQETVEYNLRSLAQHILYTRPASSQNGLVDELINRAVTQCEYALEDCPYGEKTVGGSHLPLAIKLLEQALTAHRGEKP
jgi:hypothetical protein